LNLLDKLVDIIDASLGNCNKSASQIDPMAQYGIPFVIRFNALDFASLLA